MNEVIAIVLREEGIDDAGDDEAVVGVELVELAEAIEQGAVAYLRGGDRALVVFVAYEELARAS